MGSGRSPVPVNAIHRPSGDHRGPLSVPAMLVNRAERLIPRPLRLSTIKSAAPNAAFGPACGRRTAAMRVPEGAPASLRGRGGTRLMFTGGGSMAFRIWKNMSSGTLRMAGGVGNGISIPNSETLPVNAGRRATSSMPSLKKT